MISKWIEQLANILQAAFSPANAEPAPKPKAELEPSELEETLDGLLDVGPDEPDHPDAGETIDAAEDAERINALIDRMLKHEGAFNKNGGYQAWSSDRGNWHHGKLLATKYGIIPNRLASWRGVKRVTLSDMKNLTLEEARKIYRKDYYDKPKMHLLPDAIESNVFDMGVNAGPSRAIKELQQVLTKAGFKCSVDGRIGPETVNQSFKAQKAMGAYLNNAYCDERIGFYDAIIRSRPANAKFRRGWHRRANSFRVAV